MLDVRKLMLLKLFDEHHTICATARAVHLTPTAVSQQLAALAKDVGVPLLERRGRRVYLTPYGRILLDRSAEVFAALERMNSDLNEHLQGTIGVESVGAFSTAVSGLIAPAIARLAASKPGWRFSVVQAEPEQSMQLLLNGNIDLALTVSSNDRPVLTHEHVDLIPLMSEPYDAVLPHCHALAANSDLTLESPPADEDWISSRPGTPWHDCIVGACAQVGVRLKVAHFVDDFAAAIALVRAGAGIAMIPRLAWKQHPIAGLAIRTVHPAPIRHIYAAVRYGRRPTPLLQAIIDQALLPHRAPTDG